ncbi:hypothetical protein I4U23_010002 [Adineta vaga]|nr:hypothetical protein I4U23_010002 [Adineta vaga]
MEDLYKILFFFFSKINFLSFCFSHFLTCGQDGNIYIFDTKTNEIKHIQCADQCYCLIVHKDQIFVGTNRNELEVRSYPHGDLLSSLVHFNQPVSTLYLSNSSLFIGTRDFQVIKMDLNDNSVNQMKYFHGHQGSILTLNAYEDKRWLATSCCDGLIRIFNIDKQTLIKQLNLIEKSNDIETAVSLVKVDWDKIDNMLAIPVKNTIEFYECEEWTKEKIYENNSIKQSVNLICYSPCETLFIVSYVNGQLSIVNRSTLDICMNYSSKDAVCSLVWNPIESHRFTCTTMGGEYAHVDVSEYLSKRTLTPSDKVDIDEEEVDQMTNDNKDAQSISTDVEIYCEYKDAIPKSCEYKSSMTTVKTTSMELQEPFQPTSTSKYLKDRFLLWNDIGTITCHNEEIKISFHDISYHPLITIDNKKARYTVGDLSSSAIILASSSKGKLTCILYHQLSDSKSKQWTLENKNTGKIELVRLGEDFLVIAISQSIIQFMDLSGIQQRFIRLEGPVVSISVYHNQLWIVHYSITKDLQHYEQQAISYILLNVENDNKLIGSLICNTKLIWMGFSDSGRRYYLEESGHLRMLQMTKENQLESLLVSNLKREVCSFFYKAIRDFGDKFELHVIELRRDLFPDFFACPVVLVIFPYVDLYKVDEEKWFIKYDGHKKKLSCCSPVSSLDDKEYGNYERQCFVKTFPEMIAGHVHVPIEGYGLSVYTISTDPLLTCLFYLIHGSYKDVEFSYLHHSAFSVDQHQSSLKNLADLLNSFIEYFKEVFTKAGEFDVQINEFQELRLFVGGGTDKSRLAERNAFFLLMEPYHSLHNEIQSFNNVELLCLFEKLFYHTIIIKPVAFSWSNAEEEKAARDQTELPEVPYV